MYVCLCLFVCRLGSSQGTACDHESPSWTITEDLRNNFQSISLSTSSIFNFANRWKFANHEHHLHRNKLNTSHWKHIRRHSITVLCSRYSLPRPSLCADVYDSRGQTASTPHHPSQFILGAVLGVHKSIAIWGSVSGLWQLEHKGSARRGTKPKEIKKMEDEQRKGYVKVKTDVAGAEKVTRKTCWWSEVEEDGINFVHNQSINQSINQ